MGTTRPSYDVFISYARNDGLRHAERLERELTAAGLAAWRDKRDLDPDQDFTSELEKVIEQSSRVLCCITADTRRNNSFVRREIGYALAVAKPVVPLIFDDTLPPIHIINVTREDFTHVSWNRAFSALLERLQRSENSSGHAQAFPHDPYRDYLNALYREIIAYLEQTVFSEITLYGRSTPGAVKTQAIRALPLAFWRAVGSSSSETSARQMNDFAGFREAFAQYDGRVLLLGEPGAGKTTTMFAFTRDKVAERLEDPTLPLPVMARVATWDSDKRQPLADWLAEQTPMLNRDDLQHHLDAGEALLVFDGLDELGSSRTDPQTQSHYDPRLRFLEETPAEGNVIVTSRALEYAELGEKIALRGAVTLSPLNDAQIRDYLQELPHLWSLLQSDAGLMEMARNPLLLSLLAFTFSEIGEEESLGASLFDSQRRDRIFEQYVLRRFQHESWRQRLPFELKDIYDVLGRVALAGELLGEMDDSARILNEFNQTSLRVTDLLDLHFLIRDSAGRLRFMHLVLRDYFARWARQHVPGWQQQIVDLVGRQRTAQAFNKLSGWFSDPELGELAQSAAWQYFHDDPGPLRSSLQMALDRWQEYEERHRKDS